MKEDFENTKKIEKLGTDSPECKAEGSNDTVSNFEFNEEVKNEEKFLGLTS